MGLASYLEQADAISRVLAVLLLLMSVASWALIVHKWRLLRRVRQDAPRAVAALWQARDPAQLPAQLAALERDGCVQALWQAAVPAPAGTLAAQASAHDQLTRQLRDALQAVMQGLQAGQVWLATTGAIAPFVGLLGTVWGIYHAMLGMAEAGQISLERIAGPVGEALVMTAAGLAVAIPAVLAYNLMGRWLSELEAIFEGLAHDLRALHTGS